MDSLSDCLPRHSKFAGLDGVLFGLGNPGPKYEGTRHNVGFDVLELFISKVSNRWAGNAFDAEICVGECCGGKKIALVKPLTYVNLSGESYRKMLLGSGLPTEKCVVIVDDFNLQLGSLRFRPSGSDGGHNGLKSIISAVGKDFPRLRFGIGPLSPRCSIIDFVLGTFDVEEQEQYQQSLHKAVEALMFCIEHGVPAAMNAFNNK
jgi:PTH1 family peptidyl-tRNA hydrolase